MSADLPSTGSEPLAPAHESLREVVIKLERIRPVADSGPDRTTFATRARAAAHTRAYLDANRFLRAEDWLLVADADPSDTDAPARFVAALIDAGQQRFAEQWLAWRRVQYGPLLGDVVAAAQLWLAVGFPERALSLLLRGYRENLKPWQLALELANIFISDRRYRAALRVLRPHLSGPHGTHAASFIATIERRQKEWDAACDRWRRQLDGVPDDDARCNAGLAEALDVFWKHHDRMAGESGIRWLLRRYPTHQRLLYLAGTILDTQFGYKCWRTKIIARQARKRLPDDAQIALFFLETVCVPALRVFHADELRVIQRDFVGHFPIARQLLLGDARAPEGHSPSSLVERFARGEIAEAPRELQAVCALRSAIRSYQSQEALASLPRDPCFSAMQLQFPALGQLAGTAPPRRRQSRRDRPRVAVCIAGQLRTFFSVWPAMEWLLVRPLQADVYIDTWRRTGNAPVELAHVVFEILGLHPGIQDLPSTAEFAAAFPATWAAVSGLAEVDSADLAGLHGVRRVRVEDEKEFEESFSVAQMPINQAKMFYKMAAVMELARATHGEPYDAVVRIRTDYLLTRVDIQELLRTLHDELDVLVLRDHFAGVDDQFAFGSWRALSEYARIWPLIKAAGSSAYLPTDQPHVAERLLANHLFAAGIRPVISTNTKGEIARRAPDWHRILPAMLSDIAGPAQGRRDLGPAISALFHNALRQATGIAPGYAAAMQEELQARLGATSPAR